MTTTRSCRVLSVLPRVRAMTRENHAFWWPKDIQSRHLFICNNFAHLWFYLFKICKFSWLGQAPTVAWVVDVTEEQGLRSLPICLVGPPVCVLCWMKHARKETSDGIQRVSPVGGEWPQIFLGETLEKRSRWELRLLCNYHKFLFSLLQVLPASMRYVIVSY